MYWPAFAAPECSRGDGCCYELELGQDGCAGGEDVVLLVECVSCFGGKVGRKVTFVCLKGNWLIENANGGGWVSCLYGFLAKSDGGWLLCGVALYELGLVWLYAHAVL